MLAAALIARATALIFTGRAQEGRDAIVYGRRLLRDIPDDAMIQRSFNIRLQVMERTLGHCTSSLTLGERVLSEPGTGPAVIEEARLLLAFAYCDLGQPARARRLLSDTQAPAGSYMALFWKEVGAQGRRRVRPSKRPAARRSMQRPRTRDIGRAEPG